jgi:hypothetical protein
VTRTAASEVQPREGLVRFLEQLLGELRSNPGQWDNSDLPSFLGALAAWVADMDGYYANKGVPMPEPPGWQTFAEMLAAAQLYE